MDSAVRADVPARLECDSQKWSPVLRSIALQVFESAQDLFSEAIPLRWIMR